MERWKQGLSIILGSTAATVLVLAGALAWGPHQCKLAFPMVVGCAMGNYENLAGGMFAASAALFAGWLAWSGVQVQVSAEEKRASADRVEVERVLAGDIDNSAEALGAIWKILGDIDEEAPRDPAKIAAIIWGIEQITDDAWLSTCRKMVTVLGWERRRNYETLFSALETLGQFRNADDAIRGYVAHMRLSDDGRQMMLAMRLEPNAAQHDHFVVTFDLLEGAGQIGLGIGGVAGKPIFERAGHARGRIA